MVWEFHTARLKPIRSVCKQEHVRSLVKFVSLYTSRSVGGAPPVELYICILYMGLVCMTTYHSFFSGDNFTCSRFFRVCNIAIYPPDFGSAAERLCTPGFEIQALILCCCTPARD